MKVRILRGAHQVGGSCIEVEAEGRRIVLDAGMPMGDLPRMSALLPDVPGLWARGDGSLLGVFVSHAHPDHVGLVDLVDESVPVHLGSRAAAMCRETRFFVSCALDVGATHDLADGRPVGVGPFTVTPLAVDHGIDDAFALLVEAGGKRLLYSGDLRGHGRDTGCIERLAQRAGPVNVLLMEGTRLGRPGTAEMTEPDVEELCFERFAAARGPAVAFCSSQNLDRIESISRAARRACRTPVLDLFGATMWSAAGRAWPCEARVRLPWWQKRRIVETRAFERTRAVRRHRIYDDELARRADELVILARTSSLEELESIGVLLDADAVWSMWPGYLDFPESRPALRILRRNGVALRPAHASGHACPDDLKRLAQAIAPERVVPVHTDRPWAMGELIGGACEPHADGEWWRV